MGQVQGGVFDTTLDIVTMAILHMLSVSRLFLESSSLLQHQKPLWRGYLVELVAVHMVLVM